MRNTSRLAAISTPRNSIDGERNNQARVVGETPKRGRTTAAPTGWVRGWCSIAMVSSMEDQIQGASKCTAPRRSCRRLRSFDLDLDLDLDLLILIFSEPMKINVKIKRSQPS